jgi:hypothetical protein
MTMKKRDRFLISALLALASILAVTLPGALAQTGGGYDLTWNTMDGGGVIESTGGSFSLSGTIAQPEVGAILDGGAYSLIGGFWTGVPPYYTYLPLIKKH